METKTALVRSDRTVELYTISFIYLNNTVVINPRNTEGDNSFRLNKALQKGNTAVFLLIFVDYYFKRIKNFLYSLMEFRLARVLCYDSLLNFFSIRHCSSSSSILILI